MEFDVTLLSFDLGQMAAYAQAAEALGFAGCWLAETQGDPFLGLTLAAEHSKRIECGNGRCRGLSAQSYPHRLHCLAVGTVQPGAFHSWPGDAGKSP
ncbi:MAG: LLM class flavin-dependent oxidoreductase [Chloroflexota bacterium]